MQVKQEYREVPVTKLAPHPMNPNRGNVEAIKASIERHGWYGAIIVNTRAKPRGKVGTILAGEHRWKAAQAAGAKTVPVILVDVDHDQALGILTADNATAALAERDPAQLAQVLQELAGTSAGLEGTGYTQTDLDGVLKQLASQKPLQPPAQQRVSSTQVKHLRLELTTETLPQFMEYCEQLGKVLGTSSITDTVYAAAQRAAQEWS